MKAVSVPQEKSAMIERGNSKVDKIKDSYNEGLLSEEEKQDNIVST
ncbi:MAG: hypothetical protein ORN26_02285 [Candidatus Pacebacteria bacterium]|nr:hypothetical protein [Candidatus Paceibacterota bacterium]